MFCGGRGRKRSCCYCISILLREPSEPHSPTHSTVQYISAILHQTRCNHQNTTLALWEDQLKRSRNEMYDFYLQKYYLIYKMCVGDGRKTRNESKKKNKTKEKFPRLVALPSPLLRYVFRCPRTLKTSGTYPKWDRVLNLKGQKEKRQGRAR